MVTRVRLSRRAQKDLMVVPRHIAIKLGAWADDVGVRGLDEVRKVPGYHDEPLKGRRAGQRSIRLSRGVPRHLRDQSGRCRVRFRGRGEQA